MKADLPFPLGSPQFEELRVLSRERDDESRDRMVELLLEAGLPEDEIREAEAEQLPREGSVLVGGRPCAYRFREHLLEIDGAVPEDLCRRVVKQAMQNGAWAPVRQTAPDGSQYNDDGRTGHRQVFAHSTFPEVRASVTNLIGEAARFYWCRYQELVYTGSTGWEILRYKPGQEYKRHVDRSEDEVTSSRRLSVILYLNEGFGGGETEFMYPGPEFKVTPKVGRIVCFPPGFLYPHRGCPPIGDEKIVIVGWLTA